MMNSTVFHEYIQQIMHTYTSITHKDSIKEVITIILDQFLAILRVFLGGLARSIDWAHCDRRCTLWRTLAFKTKERSDNLLSFNTFLSNRIWSVKETWLFIIKLEKSLNVAKGYTNPSLTSLLLIICTITIYLQVYLISYSYGMMLC